MIDRGDFRPWALAITPGRSQSPLCLLSGPLVELSWIIVSRINPVSSHGKHTQRYCEVESEVQCHECQDRCSTAEVQRTTEGQTALLQRRGTAAVPLLVEHSHISNLEGQRLVSVIQYTIVEPF